jgi:hypothetical protein
MRFFDGIIWFVVCRKGYLIKSRVSIEVPSTLSIADDFRIIQVLSDSSISTHSLSAIHLVGGSIHIIVSKFTSF